MKNTVKNRDGSYTTKLVDPFDIPNLMTREQLEYWILFGICVANKSAKQTKLKLDTLLNEWEGLFQENSPFQVISRLLDRKMLLNALRKHRLGQYKRINRAFKEALTLDLDNISVEALEAIHGIGPKTARMIILYYKPDAKVVPLDTHVLKFLRTFDISGIPKNTPPAGKLYNTLEGIFVKLAELRGISVRELDTEVWKAYAKP